MASSASLSCCLSGRSAEWLRSSYGSAREARVSPQGLRTKPPTSSSASPSAQLQQTWNPLHSRHLRKDSAMKQSSTGALLFLAYGCCPVSNHFPNGLNLFIIFLPDARIPFMVCAERGLIHQPVCHPACGSKPMLSDPSVTEGMVSRLLASP